MNVDEPGVYILMLSIMFLLMYTVSQKHPPLMLNPRRSARGTSQRKLLLFPQNPPGTRKRRNAKPRIPLLILRQKHLQKLRKRTRRTRRARRKRKTNSLRQRLQMVLQHFQSLVHRRQLPHLLAYLLLTKSRRSSPKMLSPSTANLH